MRTGDLVRTEMGVCRFCGNAARIKVFYAEKDAQINLLGGPYAPVCFAEAGEVKFWECLDGSCGRMDMYMVIPSEAPDEQN